MNFILKKIFWQKPIFASKNYFCQSGFYHGKNGDFHHLAKNCQPCSKYRILSRHIASWGHLVHEDLIEMACWQLFCILVLLHLVITCGHESVAVTFYPRDAMLARVFAIATCPSVRLSVTRRYCA